jgi:hypothetical protein
MEVKKKGLGLESWENSLTAGNAGGEPVGQEVSTGRSGGLRALPAWRMVQVSFQAPLPVLGLCILLIRYLEVIFFSL